MASSMSDGDIDVQDRIYKRALLPLTGNIYTKRGRTLEEESSEFMPLSKRINNLHINGFSGLQESTAEMESDWGGPNFIPSPNYSEPSQSSPLHDACGSSQSSYTADYRPDLDATENPFYYESNKLLFSLYMERMQRSDINTSTTTSIGNSRSRRSRSSSSSSSSNGGDDGGGGGSSSSVVIVTERRQRQTTLLVIMVVVVIIEAVVVVVMERRRQTNRRKPCYNNGTPRRRSIRRTSSRLGPNGSTILCTCRTRYMNFTPFPGFTTGSLPTGTVHQFATAKFAQNLTTGGQVVGVLSGGEGGVHYLRPVDPNGFAVAQGGNNQQQQIITLPITVPGKDGTQQQQTVQIQVVNPSVSQSGNSGDQPKYHLAPISLGQFPQGAATVLTVAYSQQGTDGVQIQVQPQNTVATTQTSDQTTQSTSVAVTTTSQQTIQQTVQLPGAPEGLTVVAQIPQDLILREGMEESKEDVKEGTTPVALIKRGSVKNQGNQSNEEFITSMPAGWQSLATPGSTVADYLSRLPASTLPLGLQHFLKFSAETIKREATIESSPLGADGLDASGSMTPGEQAVQITVAGGETIIPDQQTEQLQQQSSVPELQQIQIQVGQGSQAQIHQISVSEQSTVVLPTAAETAKDFRHREKSYFTRAIAKHEVPAEINDLTDHDDGGDGGGNATRQLHDDDDDEDEDEDEDEDDDDDNDDDNDKVYD
ncbi:zinc finger protein 384-like isoform X1 [Vespula maculifrons]|uniref:Zinc finger protein 384-like isoform X1 n=1 Tax=Vespula maculifrons TaxID=7453 RepID=A0ABD2C3X4_VESMC